MTTTGIARALVRARRRWYPKPENHGLTENRYYHGSRGGPTGFCAACVHTVVLPSLTHGREGKSTRILPALSVVGGWGTNYTKILPEFNTGPVLPCKYLFSALAHMEHKH